MSPRPNFILLLGERDGWRPLPDNIPETQFATILQAIENPAERALLNTWYRRDTNARPAVYNIQPRTGAWAHETVWFQTEQKLRSIFDRVLSLASIPEKDRAWYEKSATEQEILRGAFMADDAQQHVFGFFRTIERLPHSAESIDYEDLIRTHDGFSEDQASKRRLQLLKQKLRKRLSSNIETYSAKWRDGLVSEDHIPRFCQDVYQRLHDVIAKEIAAIQAIPWTEQESVELKKVESRYLRFFEGREKELSQVIAHHKSGSRNPVIICGEPGSGQSALMARLSSEIKHTQSETIIVKRFIGATPRSYHVDELLASLCHELKICLAVDDEIPADFIQLLDVFNRLLSLAADAGRVVLLMDSLERLSQAFSGDKLGWLPQKFPKNVQVIVSTSDPEQHKILKTKFSCLEVEIPSLPMNLGLKLLRNWLEEAGRTLTPLQEEAVLKAFSTNGLPLFLDLVAREAVTWQSYKFVKPGVLPDTIDDFIRHTFERLMEDDSHFPAVVSSVLSYLSVSRNGLSEDEIMDLMARDPKVYTDFILSAHHLPSDFLKHCQSLFLAEPGLREQYRNSKSFRKALLTDNSILKTMVAHVWMAGKTLQIPAAIWARLLASIETIIYPNLVNGELLYSFQHTRYKAMAVKYFLDPDQYLKRHKDLAIYFRDEHTPNALESVIHHMLESENFSDARDILTSLDYLDERSRGCDLQGLIRDVSQVSNINTGPIDDVEELLEFLKKNLHNLSKYKELFFSLALNEGPDSLSTAARKKVRSGLWSKSYFKILPKALPPLPDDESSLDQITVRQQIFFKGVAMFSCVARKVKMAFFSRRRGQLGIASLNRGSELPISIRIDDGMIRSLHCDSEARYLCVSLKGKGMTVFQLEFDDQWNLLSYKPVRNFACKDDVKGSPFVVVEKDSIIFQSSDHNVYIASPIVDGPQPKLLFPGSEKLSLKAVIETSDGFLAVFSDQEKTEVLHIAGGTRRGYKVFSGRCTAASACGEDSLCLSTSNYSLIHVSFESTLEFRETAVPELISAIHGDSRRILTLDQRSNFKDYDINHGLTMREYEPLPEISVGANEIACLDQNLYAMVTHQEVVVFGLDPAYERNQKKDVFFYCAGPGEDDFLVVRGSGNMLRGWMGNDNSYVYASVTEKDYLLDENGGVGAYDYNPRAGILACYSNFGNCHLFNTRTENISRVDGLAAGKAAVTVDEKGGIWLLYSDGQMIYRSGSSSVQIRLMDRELFGQQIHHVHGPPEFLFIYAYIKSEGSGDEAPDFLHHLMKFSIRRTSKGRPKPRLEGKRVFDYGSGRLQAVAADRDFTFLACCIGDTVFTGSLENFFRHSETKHIYRQSGKWMGSMTISGDGSKLFTVDNHGDLLVFSQETRSLITGYSGARRLKTCTLQHDDTLIALTRDNEIIKIQFVKGE